MLQYEPNYHGIGGGALMHPITPQYAQEVPVQQLRGGLQTLVGPSTGVSSIFAVRNAPTMHLQCSTMMPSSSALQAARHDAASPYEQAKKPTLLEALRADERVSREVERSRGRDAASPTMKGTEKDSGPQLTNTQETLGMRLQRRMLDPTVEPWNEEDILAVARHVTQQKRREEEKLSEVL